MKPQILIVNGEPADMEPVSIVLELAGYEVTLAAGAQQALAAVSRSIPALIESNHFLIVFQLPGGGNRNDVLSGRQKHPVHQKASRSFVPVPKTLGPSSAPAKISPSTAGWLNFRAISPKMRVHANKIASPNSRAWISWCLIALPVRFEADFPVRFKRRFFGR